ncbi:hypothetical protein GOP47_0025338 [Adiantum capillus-veneris]|uniref:Uncharacterized protein n=2 Tax=Adiantum capillus-veneris TaxID=13818 RepID=A0A9D4Z2X2_ADICA|nr:hypothetical protein GOP47_0025338 [Adiantum capillus-veneris]
MHGDGDGGDEHAQKQWQEEEEEEQEIQEVASPHYLIKLPPILGAQFALPFPLHLVVLKKKGASPVYNVGDFCFLDPHGKVLFLASARNEHTRNKRVLLNSAGIPILSAHRKMLSFYNRWDAFRGEAVKDDDSLFSVKKSAYFQIKTSLHVFVASQKESKPSFKVKGNYHERDCMVLHGTQSIAEVKRKAMDGNLGSEKDTFVIMVQPGVDHAFIAALIIIMDEIHRDQDHSAHNQL